ncbi:MAG: hypothetical protein AB7F23_08725 [Phycisphaerae bacterium]
MKEYLYIVCLDKQNTQNIEKSNYASFIEEEHPSEASQILKKYNKLLVERYLDASKSLTELIENETRLDVLKRLATMSVATRENTREHIISRFISFYNFRIEAATIGKLLELSGNEQNRIALDGMLIIVSSDEDRPKEGFTIDMATEIYNLLFCANGISIDKTLGSIDSAVLVKLIDYMMTVFNTPELIAFKSGFLSAKQKCASFLKDNSLSLLDLDTLRKLSERPEDDLWKPLILNEISKRDQNEADESYKPHTIEKVKNFLLKGTVVNENDFWTEMCHRLKDIKDTIEANRDNDKNVFYDGGKPKHENTCRDIITHRLKDRYGNELSFNVIREKHEADNRADISIEYTPQPAQGQKFTVQVECKRDNNRDLINGIETQLINKYLSIEAPYGIYLVFLFDSKNDEAQVENDIKEHISEENKNKVAVIIIDLRK